MTQGCGLVADTGVMAPQRTTRNRVLEVLGCACFIAALGLQSWRGVLFPLAYACGLATMRGQLYRTMPRRRFLVLAGATATMLVSALAHHVLPSGSAARWTAWAILVVNIVVTLVSVVPYLRSPRSLRSLG